MTPVLRAGWESDLADLLEQQRGISAELQILGRQQASLLRGSAAERSALAEISRRRRNAADHLARLVQRLEAYRRSWPQIWPTLNCEARSRLAELVAATTALVQAILTDAAGDAALQEDERCR